MSDDNGKTPAEQAMEVLVYAPIGLLFEGSTILPQLVERGRNQVNMARMIGKFAVEQGRNEAVKTASKLGDQAAGLLDFLGDSMTPAADAPPPAPAKRPSSRRPVTSGRAMAAAKTSAKPAAATARTSAAASTAAPAPVQAVASVEVGSLAITDYDGLSASHVVNRLAGLSAEELDAVRRYEAANRGRKTILSKIAQLQSR